MSLDRYIEEMRAKATANRANETENEKAKREANLARLKEEARLAERRIAERLVKEADEAKAEASRRKEENIRFQEEVSAGINQYIQKLIVQYMQKVQYDAYGNTMLDKWVKEINYFIDSVLSKNSLIKKFISDPAIRTALVNHVNEAVQNSIDSDDDLSISIDNLTPVDFEHYCAGILRKNGWEVRVTPGSGDQGVDIIATRGKVKAVFQCKKYSQPVGNAAVQEIIAGKQFERAMLAAVVSNAPYTPSARQLANSADVYLLHYSELQDFAGSCIASSP